MQKVIKASCEKMFCTSRIFSFNMPSHCTQAIAKTAADMLRGLPRASQTPSQAVVVAGFCEIVVRPLYIF